MYRSQLQLLLSKLGAGREKDLDFAKSAANLGLLQYAELRCRLQDVRCSDEEHRLIEARIKSLFA
ncbi:MAG: hypothetical protein NDI84_00810 [Steroidobacteraceae bacterium]|nr:hypothetical protein [Steroidobacteraceae bacterium]